MGAVAADRTYLFGNKQKHLVDKMHAPVKYHTAAVRLVAAPVTRYTARTVYARLYVYDIADASACDYLLNAEIVNVPAPVLMYGENFACLFGCSYHAVE